MRMNNFDKIADMINGYLLQYDMSINILSDLIETSKPDDEKTKAKKPPVYKGKRNLTVISMDDISRCYRKIKKPFEKDDNCINTPDAFLINSNNEWYFIEFKDSEMAGNSLKNNLIKKAYSNWYMMMDMLYEMKDAEKIYTDFNFNDPVKFAQKNVTYIIVCTLEKNSKLYELIKGKELSNSRHTPEFMSRLKDYLFKDAYIYTEDFFERKFVNDFKF